MSWVPLFSTTQLSDGFERSVYWNSYQTIPAKVRNQRTNIYELLSTSFQGVSFFLAYVDNEKDFLPIGKIENYNVLIDGRNFHDEPLTI